MVIVRIAAHQRRFTFWLARFVPKVLQPFLAHAALLDCWQDSNGPYHDERMLPSCAIHQGDWPALQKPNEIVLPVKRGETQCADRHHACTNLVCRPLDPVRTKGGGRSEDRRGGGEGGRTGKYRWPEEVKQ